MGLYVIAQQCQPWVELLSQDFYGYVIGHHTPDPNDRLVSSLRDEWDRFLAYPHDPVCILTVLPVGQADVDQSVLHFVKEQKWSYPSILTALIVTGSQPILPRGLRIDALVPQDKPDAPEELPMPIREAFLLRDHRRLFGGDHTDYGRGSQTHDLASVKGRASKWWARLSEAAREEISVHFEIRPREGGGEGQVVVALR